MSGRLLNDGQLVSTDRTGLLTLLFCVVRKVSENDVLTIICRLTCILWQGHQIICGISLALVATESVTSVKVGVGRPVYLDCFLPDPNDNAITNITWWNGATLLPRNTQTFSTLENGTLLIKSADYSLAGLYTCSVTGMSGRHAENYIVTVLGW